MSPKPLLTWKSWPFMERPNASFLLLIFLIFLSLLLYWISIIHWQTPFYFVAGTLLVYLNLLPYFILTQYFLYDNEVVAKYLFITIRRPYSDFGCFYKDQRGIMLSTFTVPRRLDAFRGMSLRFSKDKEELPLLIEILKSKIKKEY